MANIAVQRIKREFKEVLKSEEVGRHVCRRCCCCFLEAARERRVVASAVSLRTSELPPLAPLAPGLLRRPHSPGKSGPRARPAPGDASVGEHHALLALGGHAERRRGRVVRPCRTLAMAAELAVLAWRVGLPACSTAAVWYLLPPPPPGDSATADRVLIRFTCKWQNACNKLRSTLPDATGEGGFC